MMPDFVHNQLLTGMQQLLVLRLQGAPPEDAVEAVFMVWREALVAKTRHWTAETDGQRLPKAFSRLLAEADKWPPPKMLIERIPPRPAPLKLEHQHSPLTQQQKEKIAEHKRQIQETLAKVAAKMQMPSETLHRSRNEQIRAARQLQQQKGKTT